MGRLYGDHHLAEEETSKKKVARLYVDEQFSEEEGKLKKVARLYVSEQMVNQHLTCLVSNN